MKTEANFKATLSRHLYLLRGICIVLVVVGHVIGFSRNQGMRQVYNSDLAGLGWFHDVIITFHIPIFLIVSGIAFAVFSHRQVSYQEFFRSKFIKLLLPLVCWSPIYFIFQSLLRARSFTLLDVVRSIVFPYEIFWFLHALIFATVFAFVWFKLFKSLYLYLAVSVLLFLLCFKVTFFYNYWHWNLFYAAGVVVAPFLSSFKTKIETLRSTATCILISISLILMILTKQFLPLGGVMDWARLVNGSLGFILLYTLVSINFSLVSFPKIASGTRSIAQIVLLFGKSSMIIYLFHGYFTRGTILLLTNSFGLPHPVLYFVLTSLVGVLGPVVLYMILRPRSKAFVYSVGGAK